LFGSYGKGPVDGWLYAGLFYAQRILGGEEQLFPDNIEFNPAQLIIS